MLTAINTVIMCGAVWSFAINSGGYSCYVQYTDGNKCSAKLYCHTGLTYYDHSTGGLQYDERVVEHRCITIPSRSTLLIDHRFAGSISCTNLNPFE